MAHVAELLTIAQRIQRQHPSVNRNTLDTAKRLQVVGWKKDPESRYGLISIPPLERDREIRNNIAAHLWERMGMKGPARLKKEKLARKAGLTNDVGVRPSYQGFL